MLTSCLRLSSHLILTESSLHSGFPINTPSYLSLCPHTVLTYTSGVLLLLCPLPELFFPPFPLSPCLLCLVIPTHPLRPSSGSPFPGSLTWPSPHPQHVAYTSLCTLTITYLCVHPEFKLPADTAARIPIQNGSFSRARKGLGLGLKIT